MRWLERGFKKLERLGEESLWERERWWKEYGENREEVFGEAFGRVGGFSSEGPKDVYLPFLATDSAFAREVYLHTDLFLVSAVSMGFKSLKQREPFWDSRGSVEADGERRVQFLEGLAFIHEVLLSARHARGYACVLLDGALFTFLVKLNSAFSEAFKGGRDPLSRKLRKLYESVSEAFACLLKHEGLVAVPKAFQSSGDELEVFLRERLGEGRVNGYAFLEAVLEEGEYVVMDGLPKAVSWTKGYKRKEILSRINGRKVVFLKGAGGRIFKFEFPNVKDGVLLQLFLEFLYAYTPGKELAPLRMVDEMAKGLLKPLVGQLAFAEAYRDE